MTKVAQIEACDVAAREKLLTLDCDGLRRLATARLSQEEPGQTLQATALVRKLL